MVSRSAQRRKLTATTGDTRPAPKVRPGKAASWKAGETFRLVPGTFSRTRRSCCTRTCRNNRASACICGPFVWNVRYSGRLLDICATCSWRLGSTDASLIPAWLHADTQLKQRQYPQHSWKAGSGAPAGTGDRGEDAPGRTHSALPSKALQLVSQTRQSYLLHRGPLLLGMLFWRRHPSSSHAFPRPGGNYQSRLESGQSLPCHYSHGALHSRGNRKTWAPELTIRKWDLCKMM